MASSTSRFLFLSLMTVSTTSGFILQPSSSIVANPSNSKVQPLVALAATPETTSPPTLSSSSSSNNSKNKDFARGAALLIEDVAIQRGDAQILKNINWRVEPRTKWALIGGNGCGKSTLLKAITNELLYDGDIHLGSPENEIGYLRQTAVSGSTKTVFEEASSGMVELQKAKDALEVVQEKLASIGSDNATDEDESTLLKELDRATTRYEALGGYTTEQKVATVLKGLGFNDVKIRCDELSGGWQMRVAFAKLLLSEPKLCLMDEPGNHLDAAARKWLGNYLSTYDGEGTMILVTHDTQLLESMDHIAEVTPSGNMQVYKTCTYSQYQELKLARAKASVTEFDRNQKKAAKLQGFVDRFGASATKASAAQSRVKQIEKMEDQGLLDAPDEAFTVERFKPTLRLPEPPRAIGESLLALKGAAIGWDEKPLVENVCFDIMRGMKVLVRGPNGAGKSTILHALRGTLPLLKGERTLNDQLRLGVFTQDLAQELDGESRAVDVVTAHARDDFDITISDEQARSVLGRLGLQGEKSLRLVKNLSGGEKARVALSNFAIKPSNCILLDEVSNHLDQECVEALSEALSGWGVDDGAVVVISHDQEFCSKIGFTHVATVSEGKFKLEQRSMMDSDWKVVRTTLDGADSDDETTSAGSAEDDMDPALRKQLFNAPKRITKLESLIEKSEAKMAVLDKEMLANGTDYDLLTDLSQKKEVIEEEVMEFMEEWEELEALLALALAQ